MVVLHRRPCCFMFQSDCSSTNRLFLYGGTLGTIHQLCVGSWYDLAIGYDHLPASLQERILSALAEFIFWVCFLFLIVLLRVHAPLALYRRSGFFIW